MTTRQEVGLGGKPPGLHSIFLNSDCGEARSDTDTQDSQDPQDSQDRQATQENRLRLSHLKEPLSIREIMDLAIDAYWHDDLRNNRDPEAGFHTEMWPVAQIVKSYVYPSMDADQAFAEIVMPEVMDRGGWREVFETDSSEEDLFYDFWACWEGMQQLLGDALLSRALVLAEEFPLSFPEAAIPRPQYERFVSFAAWLQVLRGEQTIFLPCREIGHVLGCSHDSISRYRRRAVAEGFMEQVREHTYRGHRATEFAVHLGRFPEIETYGRFFHMTPRQIGSEAQDSACR